MSHRSLVVFFQLRGSNLSDSSVCLIVLYFLAPLSRPVPPSPFQDERYAFLTEWYDSTAALLRRYQLFFYPKDSSVEMVRIPSVSLLLIVFKLVATQVAAALIDSCRID